MVVIDDAAVRADRHIDTGGAVIFIAGGADLDESRSLTAADSLCLAGNADGAAADTDLDEIRARLGEEQEAVAVNDIARADLDGIAVLSRTQAMVFSCQQE